MRSTIGLLILGLAATSARASGVPPAPPAGNSPSIHAVVAAVIDAYGGHAALDTVRAYRIDASVVPAGRDTAVAMTRLFERPSRLRVAIEYAAAPEIRILDGASGWRSAAHGATPDSTPPGTIHFAPAAGPGLDAMTLQAARADLPWILAERESLVRIAPPAPDSEGAERAAPRPAAKLVDLELPLADGLTLHAFVDPATHRIVESHGVLDRGGMNTRFDTQYSDFRRVGGVWFAFHERNFAGNVRTADITFRAVTLNPTLGPEAFAPKR